METIDGFVVPGTADIRRQLAEMQEEWEARQSQKGSTPPARPRSISPWAVFVAGLGVGAAVVAIAVLAIGWGVG